MCLAESGDGHQFEIAFGHSVCQYFRFEYDGIHVLIKEDRSAKCAFVLPAVFRSGMLEVDLFGCPLKAGAFSNKIEKHSQRQFGILSALQDIWIANLVLQTAHAVPICCQPHH